VLIAFLQSPTWYEFVAMRLNEASDGLLLLGILALMVTRWITGPAPGETKAAWAIAVRVFAWLVVVVAMVSGSYLYVGWYGYLVLPGLRQVWPISLAVIIAMAYNQRVATQRYAMLALLSAAANREMPLERAFAAYGEERGGWMRQRAAQLAALLESGVPLSGALQESPGALPPEAVPLVCVGQQSGALAPAVRQAIAARNFTEQVWQSVFPKILYVCFLPVLTSGIVFFIVIAIIPKFLMIFKDFNARLPDATRLLITICHWPPAGLLLGSVWLGSTGLLVYGTLRYAGSIRWDLPGMDWLLRRRHIANVLDALALAAERQRPWGQTLATLASTYPAKSIERRLWAVCDEVEAGGDVLQCLRRQRMLGRADLALLESAQRNGNLAWAARELADSNRRRLVYRVQAVLQIVFPLVIVCYGIIMLAVATAMIYPLAALIQNIIGELSPP
jgi:type II secretory pathway component PulF